MKVYRLHKCQSQHRTVRTFLKCAIPRAAWVLGEGPYALIAWCSVPTITLHETLDTAESKKRFIDATGCGGRCANHHEIVCIDIGARVNAKTNFVCVACGRKIAKSRSVYFVGTIKTASADRVLCVHCMVNSAHLHARFWPDCEDDWHDLHDHHSLSASYAGAVAVLAGKVKAS